jgi:hypothetical protein
MVGERMRFCRWGIRRFPGNDKFIHEVINEFNQAVYFYPPNLFGFQYFFYYSRLG